MDEEEVSLKDVITEILRSGENSITGIGKKLRKEGYNYGRMFLSGYMKALKDLYLVKEKVVKPAKVYSMPDGTEKSIYKLIGEETEKLAFSPEQKAGITISSLSMLFSRAIFEEELRRCGIKHSKIDADVASPSERKKARGKLARCKINLPFNDPAYLPREQYKDMASEIIFDAFLHACKAKNLKLREAGRSSSGIKRALEKG
jgi:hypothetical protein